MDNTLNALAPSGQQGVTSREPVLTELAVELADLATRKDVVGLAARFSRLPRRDILGVREQLLARGAHAPIVDTLLTGLESDSPRVRYDTAHALDHFADDRCTGPLRRLLDDPVPRVRRMALHVLSCDACKLTSLSVPDDLADLVIDRALADQSINVRRHATVALGSFCQDARVRQILQTLTAQEKDPAILREARQALRRLQAYTAAASG
jgi:HEAT repeat protein